MNKKRKAYIEACEISLVENVNLGGFDQKIAIEGKSKDLPIVICLHGGPGSPIPFSVGCRGLFPAFTDKFILVYWDQLGCGINNRPIDDSFTIDSFVNMTVDLIKHLHEKFPNNKLYLFAMSWGSILSLRSAVKVPNLLDGVIVCGQVLTSPMLSSDAFVAIKLSNAPKKAKDFATNLQQNKDNLNLKDMMKLSKIIRKYTDGYNNHNTKPAPTGDIIKGLLASPDYKFKDFIAVVKNGYSKNQSLLKEMAKTDLKSEFAKISVPYHIFQGSTDIVTSTKEITNFIDNSENKNISYNIIENTGHFPTLDTMNVVLDYLLETSKQ